MNHCVPDFDIHIDDDEENPVLLSKKPSAARNNEIMELLWQNGSVVMHNQSHRQSKKPPSPVTNTGNQVIPDPREIRSSDAENFDINQHLFMQEDEMAAWLFDSINEEPPIINTETLFNPSTGVIPGSVVHPELLLPQPIPTASRPPIHPARKEDQVLNKKHNNFAYFANHGNASIEPSISSTSMIPAMRETTMVDSCDTPPIMTDMTYTTSKLSDTIKSTAFTECVSVSTAGKAAAYNECGIVSGKVATATTSGVKETQTPTPMLDITMTSSHGCSSGSVDPIQRKLELERKRKGQLSDKSELQRQEGKKQVRGSTSTKRSRAAEVHNLSERKRRDRINEKMKALQELIPRCNKSDKASMLDEAIEYLKSLQLQVQMMSMGCGMVPMMFPGMQQYMPSMGMRMSMGMGMEMGMNRPVMSFPNILPSTPLTPATTTTVTTPYGPRFSMPPFDMPQPHVPTVPESSSLNHSENTLNSLGTLLPDQSRFPNTNFTDPYQQFLGPHQLQRLIQGMNQQNVNRPGNSGGQANSENHQAG